MNTHTHTHTPGQWNDTGNDGKDNLIVESEYGSICAVWRVNGYACQAADARLIAAAPDMLAALRELLADNYLADPINADRMAKTRAAVAKAEGRDA